MRVGVATAGVSDWSGRSVRTGSSTGRSLDYVGIEATRPKMLNVSRRCSTPQLEHLRAHEHLRIEWMVRSSSQVCCPVMPRDATRDPRVVLISRDIELHCSMSQGITWVSSKTYRAVLFQRWIRLTINLKARHQVRRPAAHLAHQPAVRLFIAPSSPAECKRPM